MQRFHSQSTKTIATDIENLHGLRNNITKQTNLTDDDYARSWNSSHASRGGCSQDALKGTGGAGMFYCFAAN